MKKLLLILTLVFSVLIVNAQKGVEKTLTVDTLKGDNNKTLGVITTSGDYNSLAIQVTVDRISTAAGGTLYLKTAIDSVAVLVANQSTHPNINFQPNDTLLTSDVATQYWNIEIPNPGNKEYHIFGDGDVNDTIKVTTKYYLK